MPTVVVVDPPMTAFQKRCFPSSALQVIKEYLSGALTKMSTLMGWYSFSVSKLVAYNMCIINVPVIITNCIPPTVIPNFHSPLLCCSSTNQLNVTIAVPYKGKWTKPIRAISDSGQLWQSTIWIHARLELTVYMYFIKDCMLLYSSVTSHEITSVSIVRTCICMIVYNTNHVTQGRQGKWFKIMLIW